MVTKGLGQSYSCDQSKETVFRNTERGLIKRSLEHRLRRDKRVMHYK